MVLVFFETSCRKTNERTQVVLLLIGVAVGAFGMYHDYTVNDKEPPTRQRAGKRLGKANRHASKSTDEDESTHFFIGKKTNAMHEDIMQTIMKDLATSFCQCIFVLSKSDTTCHVDSASSLSH